MSKNITLSTGSTLGDVVSGSRELGLGIRPPSRTDSGGGAKVPGTCENTISCRPASFVSPIATPLYEGRDVAPLNDGDDVAQLAKGTPYELARQGDYTVYGRGSGAGFGGSGKRVPRVRQAKAGTDDSFEPLGTVLAVAAEQTPVGFRYRIGNGIDVAARSSVLLPLPAATVSAEWLTLVNTEQAQQAVRIVNGSEQTMPTGPLAIYLGGGLAGETRLERLLPGESELLVHAEEQEVELEFDVETLSNTVDRVWVEHGDLQLRVIREERFDVQVRNRSRQTKHLLCDVGLPARGELKSAVSLVRLDDEPDAVPRVDLTLAAGEQAQPQIVVLHREEANSVALWWEDGNEFAEDAAFEAVRSRYTFTDESAATLQQWAKRVAALRELSESKVELGEEVDHLLAEQTRIQGNLDKKLRLRRRVIRAHSARLMEIEQRLAVTRAKQQEVEREFTQKFAEVERLGSVGD